ncbi:hypothetical protein CLOP_g25726 [Closterium sp. NIES-67]|nr:hypothetical protein CLOP_g20802 [Closterium sp. NIES-67]GJP69097.1 hypothetical protein CLOP_g25726 [Closterium sp. NIES-67]
MARDADFIVTKETTIYSPVDGHKADLALRDRSSGAVWICDVTVTDPISSRDPDARKGRGYMAREQADKKISHYRNRAPYVGFFPLAVETYGCPCAEVPTFLKLLADTGARRLFNADPSSYQAAKLLHQFRQRWSVTLQRAQALAYLGKVNEASPAPHTPVGTPDADMAPGDCFAIAEPLGELV